MKRYTIAKGSFLTTDADGQPVTLGAGQEIELEDDVAAAHADKLVPVQTSEPAADA